jgi:MFS family permease
LIVGLGLAIFQQVSGINTVLYYAPTIFSSIGLGSLASILATVGIGVVNVGMTFVAIRYADRVGRRFLLLVGVSGMIVSLALLGLIFQVASLSGTIGWIAAIVMIAYVAFYAFSLGPMFWLLISEIFPLEVRAAGEGVASFANWVSNFVVALTFLTLINVFGRAITFWIFDVICILGLLFIYFWVPETNGRSLEEIGADLRETALGGERTDMTEGEEIEGRDR